MTDSSVFGPEEWELVHRAPILVFYYVAMADDKIETDEVERLIDLFGEPERYESSVFTQVVNEFMGDAQKLAKTVSEVIDAKNEDVAAQLSALQQCIDTKLNPDDAKAFKEALTLLGVDIAAASGDAELPVSKEEWTELESFKKVLKL